MSQTPPGQGPSGTGRPDDGRPDDARPADDRSRAAGRAAAADQAARTGTAQRRFPMWLLVVVGVLLIALVVTVVLVLTNRDTAGTEPVPEAEVVTLPVPTPTVEPIEREEGSAFLESLPSTVLAFSLVEVEEAAEPVEDGALEGYRLRYGDGDREITVLAGQWADAEEVAAVFDEVVAEHGAATQEDGADAEETAAADDEAADPAAEETDASVEQGTVEADGAEVGRYLVVPADDGSGTVWWTNSTVLIRVDGPLEAVTDVFAAFPL